MKRFLFLSLLALATGLAQAKVTLPHLLGNHMILQQDTNARLWGKAAPNATVRISVSWSSDITTAKADAQGKWATIVHTPKASYTPLSITFDDGEKLTLSDILAGEVWVGAGQSNMEMQLRGFNNCPVEGYNQAVAESAHLQGIHYVKIPMIPSATPLEDTDCHWEVVNPQTVENASATGFFFARMMNQALDIPIGIIEANKGGSRVESWLTEENLKRYTDEPLDSLQIVEKFPGDWLRPLHWAYGTFNPILNYTVKGILFYQGCSNTDNHREQYAERLAILVKQWRDQFALGEIPFYYVQIAPYSYDGVDAISGALLREQQFKALSLIPNSGLICLNDAVYPYETNQVHPTQKQKVGERLAFMALSETYGFSGIHAKSPSFKEMKVEGDKILLTFDNTYGGLNRTHDIEGFEIAGEDKVFHPAQAIYSMGRSMMQISSPDVPQPVAVRYCFRNFQLGNVKNMAGLPLFPFRTDDWE